MVLLLDVFIMSIGQLCIGYACHCLYVLCIDACHTYVDYAYIDTVIVIVRGHGVWLVWSCIDNG